jgi:hypothetical protein
VQGFQGMGGQRFNQQQQQQQQQSGLMDGQMGRGGGQGQFPGGQNTMGGHPGREDQMGMQHGAAQGMGQQGELVWSCACTSFVLHDCVHVIV